jgi:signal transduction histidine kinase
VAFRVAGEERDYLPQVLPIRDPHGDTLGAAVLLHDVTRFRILDRLKSDLVATVSHELKTPLTGVRLALHLLLEETVGPLTPKQTELLLDARDNAERLLNIIEQLLALARLERQSEASEAGPQAPAALLQAAADAARTRAEDRHVALAVEESEPLPDVAVDPERLGRALNNLLDNALRHTPAGGKVTLSARALDAGRVRLTVADTGAGIPPEHLPHVFERFFRVPGHSPEHGTGLGLAIVKEIVAAHHGQVHCESEPGKGTTFHLDLPVWAPHAAAAPEGAIAAATQEGGAR